MDYLREDIIQFFRFMSFFYLRNNDSSRIAFDIDNIYPTQISQIDIYLT